jgi:hypothetical protein
MKGDESQGALLRLIQHQLFVNNDQRGPKKFSVVKKNKPSIPLIVYPVLQPEPPESSRVRETVTSGSEMNRQGIWELGRMVSEEAHGRDNP